MRTWIIKGYFWSVARVGLAYLVSKYISSLLTSSYYVRILGLGVGGVSGNGTFSLLSTLKMYVGSGGFKKTVTILM